MWSWTIILSSMFGSGQTAGSLTFTHQHQNITVDINATAILYCCFSGNYKWVVWTRDGFPVVLSVYHTFGGRYTLLNTGTPCADTNNVYALKIENVDVVDQGVYGCHVLGDETDPETISGNATLTVNDNRDSGNAVDYNYTIIKEPHKTFTEAVAACKLAGLIIAEVHDQAQYDALKDAVDHKMGDENSIVWIGASDNVTEGEWIWTTSKKNVTFNDWGKNLPDPGATAYDCGALTHEHAGNKFYWKDWSCKKEFEFACQNPVPPSDAPVLTINDKTSNIQLKVGDTFRVRCQVLGGTPPVSSTSLTCPGGHNKTEGGNKVTIDDVTVTREMYGGKCTCSAEHVCQYDKTAEVGIAVQVPCESPTIIGNKTRNGKAWIDVPHTTDSFEIVCEAYNRKDQPTFEWTFTFNGKKNNDILNNVKTDTESVVNESTKLLTKVISTLKIRQRPGENTIDFLRKTCIDDNQLCRFTCDPKGGCDHPVLGTDVYINMIVNNDTLKDVNANDDDDLRKLIASTSEFKAHIHTLSEIVKNLKKKNRGNLTLSDILTAIEQNRVEDINLFSIISLGVLGAGCLAGGVWQFRRYRKNKRALKQAGVPGAKVDVGIQVSQEDSKVPAASGVGAGGKDKAAVAPKENSPRRPSMESGRSGMSYQSVGTELTSSPTGSLVSGSDTASMISGTSAGSRYF